MPNVRSRNACCANPRSSAGSCRSSANRAEAAFRAGLDVVSETQQRVLDGLRNTRGVSLAAREAIARIILDSNQRLHQAAPEFYPSSVQQQLAGNELYAVSSLAEIHADQGDFQNAETEVRRALELSEAYRLEEYNPLQARPGLRQTEALLARLGIIKLQQGEFDKAIDYLRQSVSAGEKGLEYYSKCSDAADFRWHLSCSPQALSVAYLQAGDFVGAVEPAERALQLTEDLASAKPEDRSLQVGLAHMLNSVGDALFETGRLAEARERFEASHVVFDRLLKEAPDDLFLTRGKSICMERFGNIAMRDKDYAGAIQMFNETLELKQHLVDADPDKWEFRSDLAIITKKLENAKSFAQSEGDRSAS
jgi:tetratricopeptide (TPR) repeat protein